MIARKDFTPDGMGVDINEASTEIERFAKKVFDKLIEENVYPIPSYYSIYFFNMLEEEPKDFKKSVMDLIELEGNNDFEEDLKFEQNLKKSFNYSKDIVQTSTFVYKLAVALRDRYLKTLQEIENVTTPQAFKSVLLESRKNIDLITKKLNASLQTMKELYNKNLATLKEIEKDSIFDSVYNIYNKNYFVREVKKEILQVNKFKHTSGLILVKATDEIMSKLRIEKSKIMVNRFIAKILLKTSRRTDVIAHMGDGVFGMLLKHTDRIGAIKTSERLSDIISNSTMFVEGDELEVKIAIGISEIFIEKDEVEIIDCAYEKLEEAEENKELYAICEE